MAAPRCAERRLSDSPLLAVGATLVTLLAILLTGLAIVWLVTPTGRGR